jgi:NAD(P)H dehydrogenase (quinone)
MTNSRVLVTAATGKIGGAVATQLLEKGVSTRALVHREDARSARLRGLGAEVVVADMLDIQQVTAAVDGVGRLFFNPPYHPHVLDSAVAFAVAARRSGVEAVVALGQWLASPEHPALMTRQLWLIDKLFGLLPDTAHVAVDPGFFADNYLNLMPLAAQLGMLPTPTGRAATRRRPTRTSPGLRSAHCWTRTVTTAGPTARPDRSCSPERRSPTRWVRHWADGCATSTFPRGCS